ncbi:thioredoxin domain-containing protein [Marinilabilia rubra]|uniref:Thioredoxin domain-containing protein n=1 Tax=Marinilabilia rubra TaxID=2162893 RepID=A0A2U2BBL6_9BACT|nr:thioredoxin domain-containing protein [Marinilabilia rubra]PWE00451.1 thioredoxin domain-containing protein [Marinilabilia rubra]
MSNQSHTNPLIHESSPYLLQHAHNPVEWHPWNQTVLDKARKEDKLILVSIGYSACHWCHVMAHECFEAPEVAGLMNQHFVCIKVDREERPDVDHFFMTAVQLMGIQGGWPLNVVTLPDGQPFWGGTYFPKPQWMEVLQKIEQIFIQDREKLTHHAHNLTTGIQQASLIQSEKSDDINVSDILNNATEAWSPQWDNEWGGSKGKPKFPMPVNLNFLLHLNYHTPDDSYRGFLETTLQKMARGGIYDQIGGGFARYSVDEFWKVPHFEKMLYDNAQLIGLYADAYAAFQKEEYKTVVEETVAFVKRELMHPSGAFFSALDADSDGEEGKYYTWTEPTLLNMLGKDFPLFADYFNINEKGYWENCQYILMRAESDPEFAQKHNLSLEELHKKLQEWKELLFNKREERLRPGLDDKTVTSWNALMISGLCKAYKALGEHLYKDLAEKNGEFVERELLSDDGSLKHIWKDGRPSINGFMEDYASVTSAFIALYEISGNEGWIEKAESIVKYANDHFLDEESGHYTFMEQDQEELPSIHYETQDNVIPSANAMMGHALFKLAALTDNNTDHQVAENMLNTMLPKFEKYPWGFAHWGSLMLTVHKTSFEVVVSANKPEATLSELQKKYLPNVLWAPFKPEGSGKLSITNGRRSDGETTIYVCSEGACQLPVHSVEEAEKLLDG